MSAASGWILFLDSTDFDWLQFGLAGLPGRGAAAAAPRKFMRQKVRLGRFNSEKTLPALLAFLKQNRIQPTNSGPRRIAKIYFVSGPGSFSGIRVGASIALALGFAWDVPVFALKKTALPRNFNAKTFARIKAKKISSALQLDYGQPPKITKEKKKKLRHT